MASLRFLGAFFLLLLLLGIVLERDIERKEKPLVFLATDNSGSILINKDSSFYKSQFPEEIQQLKSDLSEKFEVVDYVFSNELIKGGDLDYSGKSTNISNVFSDIFGQYPNRNVGAIILASDGIYNEGSNPIYEISSKNYIPIFTIGMGDTTELKDVKIDFVEHNNIAFFGNESPVDVLISHSKSGGEKVKVSIKEGERELAAQELLLNSNSPQTRLNFVLKASSIGFRKYTVEVTQLSDEFTYKNNTSNFYLEVIDGRQKILLASDEPHPDMAALRFVVENNKNYEVDYVKTEDVKEIKKYDLIVLYNYKKKNPLIQEAVKNGDRPFLVIAGIGANMRFVTELGIGINGVASNTEDVGIGFNPNFKEILLSPEVIQTLTNAPPLASPFGNYTVSSAVDVLAYQKVGNIQLEKPLIYFTKKNASRIGVILGEGFWRWRLFDQARNGSTKNFEQFFTKLISYLALKENKDPFRVFTSNEFTENEPVKFKAELYNKSFELINEPEVQLTYKNQDNNEFKSAFVRTTDAYQLDLGNLAQGIYEWTAVTVFQGETFKKTGTFLVKEVKLEWVSGRANHRLLKSISKESNGMFYLPLQMTSLKNDILNREDIVTVVYKEKTFDDLIDYKWLFLIIVFLIALEWGMRKYHGAY